MTHTFKVAPPGGAILTSCPTLIEFIIDETGSMGSCLDGAILGFNAFIDEQKAAEGDCFFTLTKFDTRGLRTPYQDLMLDYVPHLNRQTFTPNAGTNLYDAIGTRISAIQYRISGWTIKPRVLLVVLTDGSDNSSRSYTASSIARMVSEHRDWCFAYLGSDRDALKTARSMGFENAKTFETSRIRETFAEVSASTVAYRAGSSASFF